MGTLLLGPTGPDSQGLVKGETDMGEGAKRTLELEGSVLWMLPVDMTWVLYL